MKNILLFFLVFLFQFSKSQNFESTQKIIFHYKKGHYNFGKSGDFGVEEIITFQKINNELTMKNHQKIKSSYSYNPKTQNNDLQKNDTVNIKTKNITIEESYFKKLISELNYFNNKIDSKKIISQIKKPTKKEILLVAKKHDIEYYLVDDKKNKIDEFGREKINEMTQLFHFEKFTETINLNTEESTIYLDAWNDLSITFEENNQNTEYKFPLMNNTDYKEKTTQILGQPFYKIINKNLDKRKTLINFSVNEIINQKLPENSIIYQNLSYNNIKELYIYWFLKNN